VQISVAQIFVIPAQIFVIPAQVTQ